MNLGWMPLSTRPQQYCDPASIVSIRDNRVCSHLLLYTLFFFTARQSVSPPFTFSAIFNFFGSLLLPKCFTDPLYHCPCPRASDWGSRVTGHVKGPLGRLPRSLTRSAALRFATLASLVPSIHKLSHSLCSLPCGDS